MVKGRRVQVGKIDLDTCGAALLLGVSREDEVEVLKGGEATLSDLADHNVICIEVGGRGWFKFNNWDHHGEVLPPLPMFSADDILNPPEWVTSEGVGEAWEANFTKESLPMWQRFLVDEIKDFSATKQVSALWARSMIFPWVDSISLFDLLILCPILEQKSKGEKIEFPNKRGPLVLSRLVKYIDQLDRGGPGALGRRQEEMFPTLSDVFAGMLLVTRDPVEQLHAGVEILREVVYRGIDVYGRMPIEEIPVWITFAKAKAENNRQVAEAVKRAQWETTASGFKLVWLETDFFGAPGALYGVGAQVVVAFSPHFGPAGVPKFTIAGNGIRVDAVLSELNARESGWGGPPTGTILGSPREGSAMTLDEVVEIVRRNL